MKTFRLTTTLPYGGKWISSDGSCVVFNGSNITYFEKGSPKKFNFRIVKKAVLRKVSHCG